LLPENFQTLKYAGRLDRDSRGLLILSNDGNFIESITHPSKRITKRYLVRVDSTPPIAEIQKNFYRGINDEGELLKALRVSLLDKEKKIIEVVLGEGKKRQLRRMFRAMNMKILDLYRVSVGFLNLEDLDIPEGKTKLFFPEQLIHGMKTSYEKEDVLKGFSPRGK
jgi:23S rRNA pseudouridine2605 synthase